MEDACRYGQLVVMSEGLIDKFDLTGMMRIFDRYLQESESSDYILMSGPSTMAAIACAIFAAKHGCLNLLLWRFEKDGDDRYTHHKLSLKR